MVGAVALNVAVQEWGLLVFGVLVRRAYPFYP